MWPESAVPFLVDERPDALHAIGSVLPDEATLLMGSLRRTAGTGAGREPVVYNSLVVIDGTGRVTATYDKWHLVPFGEYLPLARWLEPLGVRRLVTDSGELCRGSGQDRNRSRRRRAR